MTDTATTKPARDRAIARVRVAIEHEGPVPEWHRTIMQRHRREWPVLWAALDELLALSPEGA